MNQLDIFQQTREAAAQAHLDDRAKVAKLNEFLREDIVDSKDRDFASSLVSAACSGRGATLRQMEWIGKLVDRYTQRLAAPPAPIPAKIGDVKGVVELLTRARDRGLKFPKLWLKFADGVDLRISISGPNSRTPGYLVLTDGGPFGSNRYFGKISPTGELATAIRDDAARAGELVQLLSRLASDPAKVAAEFGHLTGHCCFCSRKLTDERSTEVGYGHTCAKKFGMPWGTK